MVVDISERAPKYKRGEHPNSKKNLKVGNPIAPVTNPEGYSVTARVKQLLKEQSDFIPPHANPVDICYRDQIARRIVQKAACGDVPMVRELLDRTEGPVGVKDQGQVTNTQINIIVSSDKAKELSEKVAERLLNDCSNR